MIDVLALTALAAALFRDRGIELSQDERIDVRKAAQRLVLATQGSDPPTPWSKKQAMRLTLGHFTCPKGHKGPFDVYTVGTINYEKVEPGSVGEDGVAELYYDRMDCWENAWAPEVFHCTCGAVFTAPSHLYRLQNH